MYCSKCGNELSGNEVFCPQCGTALTQEDDQEPVDFDASGSNTGVKNKKSLNKRTVILIAIGIVCICAITAIIYFNSTNYLKKKLTNDEWYENVMMDRTSGSSSVIHFRVDGTGYRELYYRYDTINIFGDKDVSLPYYQNKDISFTWELLSDKTLRIDDQYYKYKEEWRFDRDYGLIIKDTKYDSFNRCAYTKETPKFN